MISFTEAQVSAWLAPIFWPLVRMLGMLSTAPVYSIRAFSARSKIAFALVVAVCAQASLADQPHVGFNDPQTLTTVVQELLVGAAIGFAVRLVFSAVEMAGEFIGLQMGLNFATFFDPTSNSQVSAVSRFLGNLTGLLFLAMNGHLLVVMAVIKSYQVFPVGQGILTTYERLGLYKLGGEVFATAWWIAMPIIGLLMMVNAVMGVVSRYAPQLNIFAIGFPVTLAVGLIGLTIGLPMLDEPYQRLMSRVISMFMG